MKKLSILLVLLSMGTLFLTWCGSQQPMNEQEQADYYGYTLEEYRENKQAAARMNMTIEEHAKMLQEEWEMGMGEMGNDMDK